ncbi:MAG TPA: flagellar hook-basal body complex protein FliE [Terriglobales bacterium]|jgi:flagellar hook-basal body complex protein FliE|nr:flagellar hook-basal body complex protein FliE [Terriglobales bacterium]
MTDPLSIARSVPSTVEPAAGRSGAREWGFVETLQGAMEQVDQLRQTAESKVGSLLEGGGMDVHSALIAVEKADLSFQLMMQVRNKIVAAYQEISRMQF